MALLRFTRLPKHQKYEYKPRYWDPRKEQLEERLKRSEASQKDEVESVKARLSSHGFRRGFSVDGHDRKQQAMRSNLVLLGVIAILILLSYLFLTAYLPRIVDAVGGGAEF